MKKLLLKVLKTLKIYFVYFQNLIKFSCFKLFFKYIFVVVKFFNSVDV